MNQSRLRTLSRRVLIASLLLAVLPAQGRAQYSLLYSNNFDSYTTNSYSFPSNPLPGWNAMTSQNGLLPSIVSPPVNASGNALNMNSIGGGATGWMSPDSALLAGVTDWTFGGDSRYLASNNGGDPWYGVGGIFISSTGDFSGDYIWLTIQSGWGEVNPTTTWARPTLEWKLAGTNGGGVLFPWAPPAGVTDVSGNAMRMSTDTWGPAIMGLSRTNGSSTLSYNISSPVDGPFSGLLSFSGAQATALDNLKYIGFANYFSSWQYDNLSASVRAYGLTGGAGDWSATNNWSGGLVASNGTAVNFSGAGGASTNNALNSVTGLIFSNGAGSYTVSGNAVTLGAAGIANNSGNLQTVSNDLTLGTSASFTSASGAVAVAGNTALGTNKLTFAATAAMTNSGVISGSGSVVKTGAGTLTLSGANTYSGGTTLSNGVLRLNHASAAGTGNITQSNGTTLQIDTTGTVANPMSLHNISTLQTVTLSGNKTLNNATYNVTNGTTTTESGTLSGSGGITKEGTGSLVITASNTFTGAVTVNAGVLNLNSGTGGAAGATTNVVVSTDAILLIGQSNQVNDSATVSLSGGTIRRGGNADEVFGNLTVTGSGFLDYGADNATGTLRFGTYAPSALLTVQNFLPGNKLQFGSSLTEEQLNNTALFSFSHGFTTGTEGGFFTITAIPEPSTYAAAAGLLALLSVSLAGRLPARLQKHRK